MNTDCYRLIDCGNGRRLEEFSGVICDRSAPMAQNPKSLSPDRWDKADLFFDLDNKEWVGVAPDPWVVQFMQLKLRLQPASNGQIGVFPEQESNWKWIYETITGAGRNVEVLNAFAHTGGSTIAAAAAGAGVCHLDAAKSANSRARENAELSGCSPESIRWITEDAVKFISREVKRGKKYDAIILDPPAFGRMKKKVWKFEKNMPELLELTAKLLSDNPLFLLLTAHNTGWNAGDLYRFVKKTSPSLLNGRVDYGNMEITGEGGSLSLGMYVRVEY